VAFNNDLFTLDYEFGRFKNHRFSYETLDSVATMNTAGYFSAANQVYKRQIQVGDEILATVWTTAVPAGGHPEPTDIVSARALMVVVSVSAAGVIDVSDGDSRTLTDTD
jgi:hypothetical protein